MLCFHGNPEGSRYGALGYECGFRRKKRLIRKATGSKAAPHAHGVGLFWNMMWAWRRGGEEAGVRHSRWSGR